MRVHHSLLLVALLFASATAYAEPSKLQTLSEQSGFLKTGRYAEVIALCAAFESAYPDSVRCFKFGSTPEGRPMMALAVSTSGALTPAAARERGMPVVLIQGGIHAGEIDGKDAGFLALRELLDGSAARGTLDQQVLLFVPVFNVDGHERMGRWNRPNQNGPEEMGWRTTAQNLNLNRDYAKAESAEMQAMLGLVEDWNPLAIIDLHATNGAQFEHDIAIMVEPLYAGDGELRKAGAALGESVRSALTKQGSLPLAFYPSFVESDNPASGFQDSVAPPRFSSGYFYLRNRFAMLVETHSWKDYPTRVRITRNTIIAVLEHSAKHAQEWQRLTSEADARSAALAGKPVALDYKATSKVREIDYRGYAYTRTPSAISGALMTRYDPSKPEIWRLPLRDEVVENQTVSAPLAGYLVPAAHAADIAARLSRHGIRHRIVTSALPAVDAESFRAEQATLAAKSVEGAQRLDLKGTWKRERRDLTAGALFVPIAQPKARLLIALLEPQAPDSYAAWGVFNNAFETKEYMEAYVAEEVGRDMLASDPALAETFNKRLATDPEFAKSPEMRLQFFYQRHPSWDERLNLYPVLRVDSAPTE